MENNTENKEVLLDAANEASEAVVEAAAEAPETVAEADAAAVPATVEEPASGKLRAGQLVWCIINAFIGNIILAGIALMFTIQAKKAPSAAVENKNIKTARILNLISTILGVVMLALSILSNM